MNPREKTAGSIATAALLGALALLLLYAACVVPSGQWGLTAAAGLAPLAAVASFGIKTGVLCWGGVSILGVLFLPDKLCALLFAALFGCYPMVKALAERLRGWGYVVKLLFFNCAWTGLWFALGGLLTGSLPAVLEDHMGLLYGVGNGTFLLYDYGLSKLIPFYLARIDRAIRRGRKVS